VDEPLAESLHALHRLIRGDGGLEQALSEILDLATTAMTAAMGGLTVRDDMRRPQTVVYTDAMVPEIDQAQYDHDSGPCLDAARTGQVRIIPETAAEPRWPEFAEAARKHGVRSTISLPVVVAGAGLGALNFYDTSPNKFDESHAQVGSLFAGQASIAATYWERSSTAEGLAAAMESRAVIEQAKGVIMATSACTAEEAFDLLREQSQRENIKLREIAVEIVARQGRR
jgi:transcriptional regulator with GAF, ATPase, and Fis domain